ncbi:MAG: alkyl/aryl-sulfatase [Planctomycetota bacterium]|jgi:alkyl sulfatase BDS1-like metallo-beta-lactamase superfamily hydrolase
MKRTTLFMLVLLLIAPVAVDAAQEATAATKQANAKLLQELPFADKQDFEFADRGFLGRPEKLIIKDAKGNVVWDMESYAFISDDKKAPDSVNPSLWRNAQLCKKAGLYKVIDRVYQVRGYDLSNITFVQGDKGWIVFDPLICSETAKAAYDLVTEHLGKKPVLAVIYSHSHVDHYGGVRGVVDEADVKAGKVKIIAPEHFMEHAISENVTAGNAMSRRAIYMYGALLPRNEKGGVNGGLGMTTSTGTAGVIEPTDIVTKTGQVITVDGVKMVFQMTPGAEAPTEMNTYFPQFKGLWLAENCTATLHNLYTLRGAQVRDGKKWASYIDEAIDLYGNEAEVIFQSHHWPRWGNEVIIDYMRKQRDAYKYIHDQAVRLLNYGYTSTEIAEMLELPPEIGKQWYNRGYYGSVKHDAKAVYQRYMGWYDANPANLDPLPSEPAAKKSLEYMGGAEAVIARARKDFERGEYRWVAQVMNQVVFAAPDNVEARELFADALEQLGYQAESGPWRSVYLQGAFELRNGVPSVGGINTASPDTIKAMPPQMVFDYLSIRLNGPKAKGKKIVLNVDFTDLKEQYVLTVENGVLNYAHGRQDDKADVTVTLSKATLNAIQLKEATLEQKIESGDVKISGRKEALSEFLGLLDTFPFWFNIVTP